MKPLIVANWKCNPKSLSEAKELLEKVINGINEEDVIICPPFVFINSLISDKIPFGAQNCFDKEGAFTGENSVSMLEGIGVKYVILGHSERRNIFKENNEEINSKLIKVLESKIVPILCIGEKREEREEGKTFEILSEQLDACLNNISSPEKIILAYEPVWAIGTGKFAEIKDIKEVRAFIREFLTKKFNQEIAKNIRILYGGSVDSSNVNSYITEAQMDGVLVGGASLKADEFLKLIKSA
ncbi:MAG TPA: triose-phosphate isomerase [Candidatus Pacearchaeota archaeon]|nr:triose-phosphate isomerase [Candidatus Pacearchaeota archaeon]HPR80050.1 triose-phosphate isomerase [Candidatus Pacearchaeota archaeon]